MPAGNRLYEVRKTPTRQLPDHERPELIAFLELLLVLGFTFSLMLVQLLAGD